MEEFRLRLEELAAAAVLAGLVVTGSLFSPQFLSTDPTPPLGMTPQGWGVLRAAGTGLLVAAAWLASRGARQAVPLPPWPYASIGAAAAVGFALLAGMRTLGPITQVGLVNALALAAAGGAVSLVREFGAGRPAAADPTRAPLPARASLPALAGRCRALALAAALLVASHLLLLVMVVQGVGVVRPVITAMTCLAGAQLFLLQQAAQCPQPAASLWARLWAAAVFLATALLQAGAHLA